ncbi:MAG TPA: class I SAM-dependent methyltransferase [Pyrinomonadaceae bacterium]|nr:class I SAM-dependent methyltransferase [Pyrinomonadaceae bacterium]
MKEADFLYNVVPYPSLSFPQTHPDRLATMARLFGMQPAAIEKCRVLELGCGDGTNLAVIADDLRDSQFVGIDLSERHIAEAEQTAQELNLTNISFLHGDISQLDFKEFGKFDYIIAHGLYSWVPAPVRERILAIYREMLAPQGVGYISYNTQPGCHIRQMLREMMLFHVEGIDSPAEKVERALAFLGFMTEAVEPESLYQQILQIEFEALAERGAPNLLHDDLSENNQPFYFHEFVSQAERHDLQFLAEAEAVSMQTHAYPPPIRRAIDALGTDIIRREQYLDFIKSRRFRQTLVCHSAVALDRNMSSAKLDDFFIASLAAPVSEKPELATSQSEKFASAKGATVETNHPLTKAALVYLGQISPRSVSFNELVSIAAEMLVKAGYSESDPSSEKEKTAALLLQIFGTGLVRLHVRAREFVTVAGERPETSFLARWQAARGQDVRTFNYTNIKLENSLMRALLILLDGTRDREALLAELAAKIEAGELPSEGEETGDRELYLRELPDFLEYNLSLMARSALLIS